MAEIKALDLPPLMMDLAQHLSSDMQRGKHQQSDIEFNRGGEKGCKMVFVIVLLMRVSA